MIRINLLPEDKRKESKEGLYLKIYALFLIFSFVFYFASFLYIKNKEKNLQSEIKLLTNKINQENIVVAKLQKLKKQEAQIDKRINIIIDLQKNRNKIVKSIDNCLICFPKNKMYLVKFYLDLNNIDMIGYATDLAIIAKYMKALEGTGRFHNVNLRKTVRKKVDNIYELINFDLQFNH